MERTFFIIASLLGGLSVALGAFGAHALEARISADLLQTYETAVRYQFFHVIALFIAAMAIVRYPNSNMGTVAGWLFIVGIVLFSGSLYLLIASGQRWMGAITPLGGVAFIAGWICLALAAWRS